uniref:TTF-type domain-containing protein n=1 Tax=Gouania willdenowi TaxID=441366 RepID=A0A8C5E2Z2_GOUWI
METEREREPKGTLLNGLAENQFHAYAHLCLIYKIIHDLSSPPLRQIIHTIDLPSTSAPSQTDKVMEEQQPARCARSEPNIVLKQEPLDPERVLARYPSDPAKWDQIDDRTREYFALNNPCQNIGDFSASQRKYGDINRSLTKEHFFRKKLNGETLSRKWLVYSPSTGTVFCYCCKLFSIRDNQFVTGFNDWKNCANRLHEHENSMDHRTAVLSLSSLGNKNARRDSNIVQQHESERAYWLNILKRIVATIQFLSSRGLPFRGDDELVGSPHNGNFLGCLELISRFDPLLSEHLARYGNKGRGHTSYLSSTVCDEFIQLMAKKVLHAIVKEVKDGKYFSIIVDSTPDITHVDQLALVIRYVLKKSGEPVERFLEFIPLHGHTAEHMEETLKSELKELDIDLMDCRGQSYDNASNMAGKYSGLQARIKNKNPNADFIPCSAHSLNLVGACAAECCLEAISFFGFIQNLYNFFSASTRRWEILTAHLTKCERGLTLKSLSSTRSSARADATKALRFGYKAIQDALNEIKVDHGTPRAAQYEASQLITVMETLETAVMTVLWDELLRRINFTSKALQEVQIDVCTVPILHSSLIEYMGQARNDFDVYEAEAKTLTATEGYKADSQRRRVKKVMFGESAGPEVRRSGREAFLIDTHYEDFTAEFCQFISMVKDEESVMAMYKKLLELGLRDAFPNVDICLRMYLTLPIANCSGERSFSLLKRVKTYRRATVTEKKLNAFALLAIENGFTTSLDFEDIIEDFTASKLRRKHL